jgi:flagellar protein FlaJ
LVKLNFNSDILFVRRFQIVLVAASAAVVLAVAAFSYTLLLSSAISLFRFHVFVVIGLMVGLIAPSAILLFQERRRSEIDSYLPRVLEDISEGQHAGMTLIEAIGEASRRDYGWISKELKTLVAQMTWGVPIEEAFENFSRRVGTDIANKTMTLLLAAIRLGGDLRVVFNSTARFVHKMLEVREDRNEQMKPYLSLVYVTLVVFLVTMMMLYNSLSSFFEMQSPILKVGITRDELKILLFDLSVMEALFGGIIASKLSQGSVRPGLKHSVLMLVINTAAFLSFF